MREQWVPMLRLGAYISLTALSFYIFSTYMTTFLRSVVGMGPEHVLLSNVLALTFAARSPRSSAGSVTVSGAGQR